MTRSSATYFFFKQDFEIALKALSD